MNDELSKSKSLYDMKQIIKKLLEEKEQLIKIIIDNTNELKKLQAFIEDIHKINEENTSLKKEILEINNENKALNLRSVELEKNNELLNAKISSLMKIYKENERFRLELNNPLLMLKNNYNHKTENSIDKVNYFQIFPQIKIGHHKSLSNNIMTILDNLKKHLSEENSKLKGSTINKTILI